MEKREEEGAEMCVYSWSKIAKQIIALRVVEQAETSFRGSAEIPNYLIINMES